LATGLQYFREAAPAHTADEEESLFPRLRQNSGADAMAVMARIDSLEQEHECAAEVHDEVDRLGRQWLDQGTLHPDEASRLATLLDQLDRLYHRHIRIEETEVFPLAANLLTASERRSLGKEMASRRGLSESAKP
jgi:iron-sulfur cluster repair protein YtfE (RIC family)